jgi:hypothetical protein
MLRAILVLILLAALVAIVGIWSGWLNVSQTRQGELPAYNVQAKSVTVGTVDKNVQVPTITTQTKTVKVPTIGVEGGNAQQPAQNQSR